MIALHRPKYHFLKKTKVNIFFSWKLSASKPILVAKHKAAARNNIFFILVFRRMKLRVSQNQCGLFPELFLTPISRARSCCIFPQMLALGALDARHDLDAGGLDKLHGMPHEGLCACWSPACFPPTPAAVGDTGCSIWWRRTRPSRTASTTWTRG